MNRSIIVIFWIALAISYLIRLYLGSMADYYANQAYYYENEIKRLKRVNLVLAEELAKASSYNTILINANKMGFTEKATNNILYLGY